MLSSVSPWSASQPNEACVHLHHVIWHRNTRICLFWPFGDLRFSPPALFNIIYNISFTIFSSTGAEVAANEDWVSPGVERKHSKVPVLNEKKNVKSHKILAGESEEYVNMERGGRAWVEAIVQGHLRIDVPRSGFLLLWCERISLGIICDVMHGDRDRKRPNWKRIRKEQRNFVFGDLTLL